MIRQPLVSIIIAHWNGEEIIKDCLESLSKTTYENYEVIVVDNASTDNSVKIITENFSDIKIVQNNKNYGFAGGNNIGYNHAKGEIILLLNNDTNVESDWLENLVKFSLDNPQVGILQPKIKSLRNRAFFEYAGAAGGFIDKYGYPFLQGRIFDTLEEDQGQYDDFKRLFWASGCALFVKREVIEKIGFLDEDFFAHQEEIDFCWRANIAGYRIYYVPNSVIYHLGGGTLNHENYFKLYLNHRNNITMILKNADWKHLFKIFFPRLCLEMLSAFKSFKRFRAVFASLFYNVFHFTKTWKKREVIQNYYEKNKKEVLADINSLVYDKSIVFSYFFDKIKYFSQLKWKDDEE